MGGAATLGTASVLFTDLVGSTALRSRLGDDVADDLRRVHDDLLTGAIHAHGGRVVKGLGDGIMATFDSAAAAVSAAVEIQQAAEAHGRRRRTQAFEVRIGISTGDVSLEDGDVFGTPVVEAGRLCDAAGGGQILVSQVVQLLARSRSGARFAPVGALELKGLADPLETLEVLWDPVGTEGDAGWLRFPPALADRAALPFTGRSAELDALQRRWKAAAAGSFGVVLLGGEPGAGKTRLAAEFSQRVHAGGVPVLHGRCDQQLDAPFQPLVEALRGLIAATASADLSVVLGAAASELVPVVPELTTAIPGLALPGAADPDTERFRLISAFVAALRGVAADDGAVVVVDDLQWADRATLQVLRLLVREQPSGLLVVGTFRDTEGDGARPWATAAAELGREATVERIHVGGLDEASVVELLTATAGDDPVDRGQVEELAEVIRAETEGHAFFVGELLRHLAETGGVALAEGRWQLTRPARELGVPAGVRDVVNSRIGALGDGAMEVLGTAAVVGARIDSSVVAHVVGDPALVDKVFDEAVGAQLLTEEGVGRFRFTHALVEAALHDRLSATRRARLHHGVAQALEVRGGGDPARLGRHWEQAVALDPDARERAVAWFVTAGDAAVAGRSPDAAIDHYRRALGLAAEGGWTIAWTVDVSTRLGSAERQAGDPAYRQRLIDAARDALGAGLTEAAATALLESYRGTASIIGVTNEELIDLIEATLDRGTELSSDTSTRLLAIRAVEMATLHDEPRRTAAVRAALAAVDDVSDPAAAGEALTAALAIPMISDQLDDVVDVAERLDRLCPRLPPRQRALARYYLAWWATAVADATGRADAWRREAHDLAEELGEPMLRCLVAVSEIEQALLHDGVGPARAALAHFEQLAELANEPDLQMWREGSEVVIDLYDRAITERHVQNAELAGVLFPEFTVWQAAHAYFLATLGRAEEAAAHLDVLADRDFDAGRRTFGYVPALLYCALATASCGGPHRRRIRQLLGECRTVIPTVGLPLDTPAYAAGLIDASFAEHDAAIERFRTAIDIYRPIGAPLFEARARAQLARSLAARDGPGDLDEARALARTATSTAEGCGLRDIPDLGALLG